MMVILAVIVTVCGCSMATMGDKAFLKVGIKTEATDLDPASSRERLAKFVINNLYEGLISVEKDGSIIPAVAESWQISEDDRTIVFKLRKDAKWSDGKQVTASDFKYSWLRTLKEGERGRSMIIQEFIRNGKEFAGGKVEENAVGIQVIDERTLMVRTLKPSHIFLHSLTSWSYSPVRKESVESGPEWYKMPDRVISNGPFKMLAREEGISMSLVQNPFYWNKYEDGIDGIKFIYFENRKDYLKDFNVGFYDLVILGDVMKKKDKYNAEGEVLSYQDLASRLLVVNHKNDLLKNKWVRLSISEAIDRVKAQEVSTLFGRLPSRLYAPEGLGFPDRVNGVGPFIPPPDSELAKTYLGRGLDELGFEQGDLIAHPILLAYHNPEERAYMESIASDLKTQLGLTVTLELSGWKNHFDNVRKGEFDLAAIGYTVDYPYPTILMEFMSSKGMMGRACGINDPAYDQWVEKLMAADDESDMKTIAKEAEDVLLEEAHLIPLSHDFYNALVHDNVEGLDYNRITGIEFQRLRLIK